MPATAFLSSGRYVVILHPACHCRCCSCCWARRRCRVSSLGKVGCSRSVVIVLLGRLRRIVSTSFTARSWFCSPLLSSSPVFGSRPPRRRLMLLILTIVCFTISSAAVRSSAGQHAIRPACSNRSVPSHVCAFSTRTPSASHDRFCPEAQARPVGHCPGVELAMVDSAQVARHEHLRGEGHALCHDVSVPVVGDVPGIRVLEASGWQLVAYPFT